VVETQNSAEIKDPNAVYNQ